MKPSKETPISVRSVPQPYPPPSSQSIPQYPGDGVPFKKTQPRKLDTFVGTLMTVLAVLAAFIVLVVMLKNISPNAPTQLVPATPAAASDESTEPLIEEPNADIVGD